MERYPSLGSLALLVGLAAPLACSDSQRNPLPTIRLGAAAIQSSPAATGAALIDRDTTTAVTVERQTAFTLSLPRAAEIRRIKVFAAGVRVSTPGGDDLVRDGAAESWGTLALSSPLLSDRLTVTVTPMASGAHVSEIELWGAGAPQAPRDPQALAEATASDKAIFENAIVLRASPDSSTITPGSSGPTCLNASLPESNPRSARRAYLAYESTARRAVVLLRSIDGQPASGGFWIPPASNTRTLVDEIDPEQLKGTGDGVSLCLPDDATGPVDVSGLRLVLLLDDGSDLFARETHVRWQKATDGDSKTGVAVGADRIELALDRPISLDAAELQLGAVPARLSSVGTFDGNAWGDRAGLDLRDERNALPLAGQAPQAVQLTFSGSARTDVPAASVSEVQLSGSGVGPRVAVPRIVVAYPALTFEQGMEVGERFGDRAYLSGWAESPAGHGTVEIGGATVGLSGAFGIALDRPAEAADSWPVAITARFPDGTMVTRTIHLDDDHASEVNGSGQAGASVSDDLRFGREDETAWGTADPANGGKVKLGTDVSIDIPPGAVGKKTGIGVTRKGPEVMPPLDAGMVNVTAPAHGAYRFLPKGQKFAKAVKLTIPYEPSLVPDGMAPEQIQTFYYDDDSEEWRALPRDQVLRATNQIVSETTHFTFMINAVLVAPDHPGPTSFNPNSIKDLKAADPSSGIDLIEAPQGNNQGTAQLALPIRLPRARGAYQPELRLAYDSSADDGWAGVGWDLSVSSVQIDTRFGVPTYTAGDERYLLDGAQLVPTSETSGCQDGTTGAIYRSRVEHDFKRIVRCGTGTASYWFEVADKSGVLHVYGHGDGARLRSYDAPRLIGRWFLERVVDTNGNLTEFFYDLDDRSQRTTLPSGQPAVHHGEEFQQLYLASIQYSGRAAREGGLALAGGTSGLYQVQVESEQDGQGNLLERPDAITSARLGFKVVTRRRLHAVRVKYGSQQIREYRFTYEQGSFGKSRMTRADVYGSGDSPQLFYIHTFAYTDASPIPFDAPKVWTFPGGDDKSLTRSEESGAGIHFYAGISSGPYKQGGAAGFRAGMNTSSGHTTSLFIDVNGDGLPDRIVDNGEGTYSVHYNTGRYDAQVNPGGQQLIPGLPKWDPGVNASQPVPVPLPTLGAEHSSGWNAAFQALFGLVGADLGYSYFSNTATDFLTDADGDGFIDVVQPDGILLQQSRTTAAPAFSFAASKVVSSLGSSPSPSESLQKSLTDTLRPSDVLLEWIAPYDGVVDLTGALAFPGRRPTDPQWDGVRLRVYRVDGYESSVTTQLGSDFSLKMAQHPTDQRVNISGLTVSRGTRLYFLLSTLSDFPVDPSGPSPIEEVSFAPNIVYIKIGNCAAFPGCRSLTLDEQNWMDPAGAGVFAFDASHDFKLGGNPLGAVVIPNHGQLSLSTVITKVVSSDDVRACIQKFAASATVDDIPCSGSGDFVLLGGGTRAYTTGDAGVYDWSGTYQVQAGEKLVFRVESDLPIDPDSVAWNISGAMTQVCDSAGGNCRAPDPKEMSALSFVGEAYLPLHLPLDPSATLNNLDSLNPNPEPLVPFVVPDDGTLTITTAPPSLATSFWSSPVWLTARNAKGYLFKQTLGEPSKTVEASVTRGELIYFEAHSEKEFHIAWSPRVMFNGIPYDARDIVVNATFDYLDVNGKRAGVRSIFGGGFHGWHYGAWHGTNDQAFDASLFKGVGGRLQRERRRQEECRADWPGRDGREDRRAARPTPPRHVLHSVPNGAQAQPAGLREPRRRHLRHGGDDARLAAGWVRADARRQRHDRRRALPARQHGTGQRRGVRVAGPERRIRQPQRGSRHEPPGVGSHRPERGPPRGRGRR